MFSAIFGSIFNGRVEEQPQNESKQQSEASTQTFENKSTSTQVNLDTTKTNLNDTATSQQDWVIVDESETNVNDKACGDNLVEMVTDPEPEPENTDPLIGSFFQKNEQCDDEERWKSYRHKKQVENIEIKETDNKPVEPETVTAQTTPIKKNDTWLITPSPCLTSITESSQQKSMIDNDPLENLLIEQPSRFMSTSTCVPTYAEVAKSPKSTQVKPKKQDESRKQTEIKSKKPEVMQSDDICEINFLFNETEVPVTPISKRTTAEKRKEAEKSSPISPTINESPKKISRKSTKSMKTKQSNQHAKFNKENMQVKTLLMAECFPKNETKHKGNRNRYAQMSRANKNAALFSMATNTRQRKFHNLQQPSNFTNTNNQF